MKTVFTLLLLAVIADAAIAATPSSPKADAAKPAVALPPGHVPINTIPVDLENIKVQKASGPDARTVAEVVTKRVELDNKTVVVRGKVVKYSHAMDKYFVHLRDGTGSDADYSNDVLVTTNEQTKVGDVVTAKGIVHIDKDFGSGYSYKVLIEEATLQK